MTVFGCTVYSVKCITIISFIIRFRKILIFFKILVVHMYTMNNNPIKFRLIRNILILSSTHHKNW